ncbi:RluA family pseudouridine synthase [Tenacibaculum tangerinum]|uniref:RluA family pseudouridine synthase n=1 Tax=Tenacibaculum tangerinum TaxID=3038772 RepID=A0ABY8L464_9FLAO|nr:RluA family pseudouridine synthase [Tenacibaculum tangerinum]WGH75153.1 RluA family pseudouridine synthase [Tenacibaculum tangerinum]
MHSTEENLQVLHEDNHIIVINKRAGDIVQGDKTGDKPLSDVVKEYIKRKYNKPGNVFLGTVHRLDRPTSGIVIYARTSKALERLNKMLRDKTIKKTYWAVVQQQPKKAADTLTHYLKKNPKNNKSAAYTKEVAGSKKAILHYKTLKTLENYSLLEVDLETGRHHQIRVQLATIGAIIKGDLKYGAKRSNKDGSIHLHARKIELTHPVSKELIKITAPTPSDPVWDACL